jgi:AraC family transcriptional regulator
MPVKPEELSTVEAEIASPSAIAQIRHVHLPHAINHRIDAGKEYWLEMSLTPRDGNPRVHYQERWQPHRYEPVGNAFMLNCSERIQGVSEKSKGRSVVCKIGSDAMRRWTGSEPDDWTDQQLLAALNISSPSIHSLLARLATELRAPGFASDLMVEHISGQLAIEMQRFRMAKIDKPACGGLSPWQLRIIDERLKMANVQPSLDELAKSCEISVRHLTRAFKTSKGCSIGEYVANQRIELAKRLLLEGDSIKSIAPKTGFSSVPSFSYAFRRATGMSPGVFREALR